jgi:hypothetical protein
MEAALVHLVGGQRAGLEIRVRGDEPGGDVALAKRGNVRVLRRGGG